MRLVLLLGLAACTDTVTVAPVIDSPIDTDSAAFPDIDEITLTVAHAGSADDLVSASFTRGQPLELTGVPFADDLVVHMSGQIGGSPVAYGRTCTFALTATEPPPKPHLFFSRTLKFAELAATAEARTGGLAMTYHDGSGLLLGGLDGTTEVADVEHFDPRTGTLDVITQLMSGRTGAVGAALGTTAPPIALIGGDFTAGSGFYELLEVDGVRVDNFPDTHMARQSITATTLTDGSVVVVGGLLAGVSSGEIDELSTDTGMPAVTTARPVLAHPRHGHTATRLGSDFGAPVLIAGGQDEAATIPIAELFKPLGPTLASPTTFAPAMLVPRTNHHAILMPDSSVLIMGGTTFAGDPVTTLELFSLDTGFVSAGVLPANAGVIDFTATTLPDGRVLITGGRLPNGPALATAFLVQLDSVDGSVDVSAASDSLAVPRAGHQATLLCDGTVLISGGTDGPSLIERYNPPPAGRR